MVRKKVKRKSKNETSYIVPKPQAKLEIGAEVSVSLNPSKPFETDMTGTLVSLSPHLVINVDYQDDFGEMLLPWSAVSGVWVRVPDEDMVFEFKKDSPFPSALANKIFK